MEITRRKTKEVKIGSVKIGGNNPIAIQSMAKEETKNISRVVGEIKELEEAGCEVVRVAVKDELDAVALGKIKKSINIPLVADIHFNYKLALAAISSGVDKIRLNPGNIYKIAEIKEVVRAAKAAKIAIRVGVNSGSIRKSKSPVTSHTLTGTGQSSVNNMVQSALDYISLLEKFGFYNIAVSLKASNILDTVDAYRKISKLCNYPLHLGVTATGAPYSGVIKSSVALGILLSEGIGDTMRVSLTDEAKSEIKAARTILQALGLRSFGPEVISCPTCGRCEVDLINIVKKLEEKLCALPFTLCVPPPKVAVMGCVVNGPGEAKEADIGIAFGKKDGLLFKKGKPIKKVSADKCVEVLLKEIVI